MFDISRLIKDHLSRNDLYMYIYILDIFPESSSIDLHKNYIITRWFNKSELIKVKPKKKRVFLYFVFKQVDVVY